MSLHRPDSPAEAHLALSAEAYSAFPPIAEYGFLSDCQVNALVAPGGTVEWLCLPRADSPSVFAAILDRAAGDPGLWGMGTTLTAAAVAGDRQLQLAHVGDSRAYLLREGAMEQLTTDHTVVGELVRRGRLTPAQAAIHPERSILTRAVGLDPSVPVDLPDLLELRAGDQLLLCSDGLTEAVDDDQIADILATTPDGDAACRALIDAANAAGGPDNITVVLLRAG
jgi:protein phosphatase